MSETQETIRLQPGDKAPDLVLVDQQGNSFTLADHTGERVIVYFYPKAETPGCTKESCDFRDNLSALTGHGYTVVGVSPDKPEKLESFNANHSLGFTLLSDPTKQTMAAWGAFGEKKNYGRVVQGVIRSTFVIDKEGVIEHAMYNVKATGHVARVLKTLGVDDNS
ncbi:thioredoxin-dependent thiol peroxidase [Corynebacterium mendelii]|uniref:thioredoxin-dependent peroxiredoxin n=1 Tax=Corynebacterium mendelii TaxID=2765362 RepID=A0A939DZX6_9CORY|nr:thioredoxin-dependent thiol peroxidase [Corynebacterium mendelii]MBN9643920.1 thioredoxin-dependent thiol peroxidase [Corynebacterium mendelii]